VATKNLILHLPIELVRQAKVYAAQHDTSIDGLVKELLEQKLSSTDSVWAAGLKFLEGARRGPQSNVDISLIRREGVYER
jgi:plasmid stability protein